MRLIDADLLEPDAEYDDGEYWAYSKTQIENAPIIELILCKDCKLFGDEKCLMYFDGYDWAEPDGYCHCAERRTDEGFDRTTGGD